MSAARNHHWISQGYLRGFSSDPTKKNAQVFVTDFARKSCYLSSIRNVCSERDFNRIDVPGMRPDELETKLAKFDDGAAAALREVNELRRTVGSQAWNYVLNLMAMIATRNPSSRQRLANRASREILRMLDNASATKEAWDAIIAAGKEAGHIDPALDTSYERHQEFIAERRFKLVIEPEFLIIGEFKAFDLALRMLAHRKWLLLEAPIDSPGFITTDEPVCLHMADGTLPTTPIRLDNSKTAVMFAISPTLLAYGTFNGREGTTKIDRRLVSQANVTLLQHTHTRLFAPRDQFDLHHVPSGLPHTLSGDEVLKIVEGRVEFHDSD